MNQIIILYIKAVISLGRNEMVIFFYKPAKSVLSSTKEHAADSPCALRSFPRERIGFCCSVYMNLSGTSSD